MIFKTLSLKGIVMFAPAKFGLVDSLIKSFSNVFFLILIFLYVCFNLYFLIQYLKITGERDFSTGLPTT